MRANAHLCARTLWRSGHLHCGGAARFPIRTMAASVIPVAFVVSPDVLPVPTSALSLDGLHAVLGGSALLHRFPCGDVFDTTGWGSLTQTGSRTQARRYARNYRRPDATETDMCADNNMVFSLGAPPTLIDFSEAWGAFRASFHWTRSLAVCARIDRPLARLTPSALPRDFRSLHFVRDRRTREGSSSTFALRLRPLYRPFMAAAQQ